MTKITLDYDYEKLKSSLRGYYQGRNWYGALRALDICADLHVGVRKNGEPEFSHQIFQAQLARTLDPMMIDPEGTHITILYHDAPEDHDYPLETIEKDHQRPIRISVEYMTNVIMGVKLDKVIYYNRIGTDPRASVAKGIDRVHNLLSALGVFKGPKMFDYRGESRDYIIPMMKTARKLFPQQERVYQNIKTLMLMAMLPEVPHE